MPNNKEPWLLGKEAQWDGLAEEENPFTPNTPEWREWLTGYREAQRIEEGSGE